MPFHQTREDVDVDTVDKHHRPFVYIIHCTSGYSSRLSNFHTPRLSFRLDQPKPASRIIHRSQSTTLLRPNFITMQLVTKAIVLSSLLTTSTLATPSGDARGSHVITPAQARALVELVETAQSTGQSIKELIQPQKKSLLGDIFGGDDGSEPRGYAPYNVTCPSGITWNRPADSLSSVETDYLNQRQPALDSAWQSRTSAQGLTMPSRTPKVAMALSGGGYRAMIHGSGQAFLQNTTQGSVGDVLGLTSYVGGLSGGSWAISTWMANDGAQPDYLVRNVSGRRSSSFRSS